MMEVLLKCISSIQNSCRIPFCDMESLYFFMRQPFCLNITGLPLLVEVKGHKDDQKAEKTQESKDGEEEEQQVEEERAQHLAVDGETDAAPVCMTPAQPPPRTADPMRTPRLSDFGLSGFHLLAPLGEPVPPSVPFAPPTVEPPALSSLPRVPKTPKCALKMDEEALTPRLEDFGISEHTMCLNNDFTMDLLRKKPSRLHRYNMQ